MARRYFADAVFHFIVDVGAGKLGPGHAWLVALPRNGFAGVHGERLAPACGGEQVGAEDVRLGGVAEGSSPGPVGCLPAARESLPDRADAAWPTTPDHATGGTCRSARPGPGPAAALPDPIARNRAALVRQGSGGCLSQMPHVSGDHWTTARWPSVHGGGRRHSMKDRC